MSPRTEGQFEEIREKSKDRILYAALELFAVNGYHATSVGAVAKHAGISKGLIYNYYESKEALLRSIVMMSLQEADSIFEEVASNDPAQMLENLLEMFYQKLGEKDELWRLIISLALQVGKFEFLEDIVKMKMEGFIGIFEDLLRKLGHQNPAEEAKVLSTVFDGLGIQYLILGDRFPGKDIKNHLIEKYCNVENVEKNNASL